MLARARNPAGEQAREQACFELNLAQERGRDPAQERGASRARARFKIQDSACPVGSLTAPRNHAQDSAHPRAALRALTAEPRHAMASARCPPSHATQAGGAEVSVGQGNKQRIACQQAQLMSESEEHTASSSDDRKIHHSHCGGIFRVRYWMYIGALLSPVIKPGIASDE